MTDLVDRMTSRRTSSEAMTPAKRGPRQPPDTFHQIITVATLDGHTRITRIEKAPS
ncbi:hypothetical protein [Nocardia cyriacigeorgica]|uniref:hypothetical protein n=1 Tax=Nocardia cyriacigeorgica TaxID=135487 RepID=UPI002453AD6B|nr:hypothetical protein [Nocardia cyriacigeorgica]